MDDAARGTSRLFRWVVRPNPKDDPEDNVALPANVHAIQGGPSQHMPIAAE
jgi:hypothetical protein